MDQDEGDSPVDLDRLGAELKELRLRVPSNFCQLLAEVIDFVYRIDRDIGLKSVNP